MKRIATLMVVGCLVFSGCSKADPMAEAKNLFVQGCDAYKWVTQNRDHKGNLYMPETAKDFFLRAAQKDSQFEKYYFTASSLSSIAQSATLYSETDLKAFRWVSQNCDVIRR